MEELGEGFGQLSTSAKEWRPSSSTSTTSDVHIDTATETRPPASILASTLSPSPQQSNNKNIFASPSQQQQKHYHHQNAAAATMNTSPTLQWKPSSSLRQQQQQQPWISSPLQQKQQQRQRQHQRQMQMPNTPPALNSPWNTNTISPQHHHQQQSQQQQQAVMMWPEMPSFNSDGNSSVAHPTNSRNTSLESPSSSGGANLTWMPSSSHHHQQQHQGCYPPLPPVDVTTDATATITAGVDSGDTTAEAGAGGTTMMSDIPTSIPRPLVSSTTNAPMSSITNIMDPNQIIWWRHFRHLAFTTEQNENYFPRLDVSDPIHKAIPPGFLAIRCLDTTRSSFGYPMTTLHVISRRDGQPYCLRRVDNVRYTNSAVRMAATVTEQWNPGNGSSNEQSINAAVSSIVNIPVSHSSLVRLFRCFVAHRAFFFLHEYISGAQTLRERFFLYHQHHHHHPVIFLPESILWSCVVQAFGALRTVHASNLACRTLQCHHILCTISADMMTTMSPASDHQNQQHELRLYINCTGMLDILEIEGGRKPMSELQQEDWNDLGKILLSLATGIELTKQSPATILQQCLVFISHNYSPDFYRLVYQLLQHHQQPSSSITSNIAPHIVTAPSTASLPLPAPLQQRQTSSSSSSSMTGTNAPPLKTGFLWQQLEHQVQKSDRLEAALRLEYDSSRVLRLLLKLGFINERPELGRNRQWTESGDCYVLKLFRDYVFHQADEGGNPVMDLGHVVTTLNKLDAALEDEQIILTSREGKTMLVVSYADVARSLEKAYTELCQNDVSSLIASQSL
eukprot:CAMPEP_0194197236 /NCGR_PEP_ID=MMETSP0154-20130528/77092_1 /TAXON_ID=1049557 /ORGANISM="Thalassiothrix antarctica, Strain L6-D1" /LENGTH=791 /DNA_ID=CAMNT_0038921889 /DNA_START=92 /DNA_END=2467 /DNA_ORIENTATION=+